MCDLKIWLLIEIVRIEFYFYATLSFIDKSKHDCFYIHLNLQYEFLFI